MFPAVGKVPCGIKCSQLWCGIFKMFQRSSQRSEHYQACSYLRLAFKIKLLLAS
jgi:hypothetical protein